MTAAIQPTETLYVQIHIYVCVCGVLCACCRVPHFQLNIVMVGLFEPRTHYGSLNVFFWDEFDLRRIYAYILGEPVSVQDRRYIYTQQQRVTV